MTRFGIWMVCCVVVFFAMLAARPDASVKFYWAACSLMGCPLLLHWLFNNRDKL